MSLFDNIKITTGQLQEQKIPPPTAGKKLVEYARICYKQQNIPLPDQSGVLAGVFDKQIIPAIVPLAKEVAKVAIEKLGLNTNLISPTEYLASLGWENRIRNQELNYTKWSLLTDDLYAGHETSAIKNDQDRQAYTATLAIASFLSTFESISTPDSNQLPTFPNTDNPRPIDYFLKFFTDNQLYGPSRKPNKPSQIKFSNWSEHNTSVQEQARNNLSDYVCITHQGRIYQLPVVDKRGLIVPAETLYSQIRQIIKNGQLQPYQEELQSPFFLVNSHGNKILKQIHKDNREAAQIVSNSLAVIRLDSTDAGNRSTTPTTNTIIKGDRSNISNTIPPKNEIVITPDGRQIGLSALHGPNDGFHATYAFKKIINSVARTIENHPSSNIINNYNPNQPPPTPLIWNNQNLARYFSAGNEIIRQETADTINVTVEILKLNTEGAKLPDKFIKDLKIFNSDSYLQLLQQLVMFDIFGRDNKVQFNLINGEPVDMPNGRLNLALTSDPDTDDLLIQIINQAQKSSLDQASDIWNKAKEVMNRIRDKVVEAKTYEGGLGPLLVFNGAQAIIPGWRLFLPNLTEPTLEFLDGKGINQALNPAVISSNIGLIEGFKVYFQTANPKKNGICVGFAGNDATTCINFNIREEYSKKIQEMAKSKNINPQDIIKRRVQFFDTLLKHSFMTQVNQTGPLPGNQT